MDKEKVIQSLGKLDIDKVIYLTASMHIKGNDWVHGEAVRSFMDSGRRLGLVRCCPKMADSCFPGLTADHIHHAPVPSEHRPTP